MTSKSQSCLELTRIQISGALSLPVILVGYFLGAHYTLYESIMQIMIGNAVLLVFAMLYAILIARNNVPTIEFATYLFGPRGRLFFTFGMLVSLIGWTAIQLHLISALFVDMKLASLLFGSLILLLSLQNINGISSAYKGLLPLLVGGLLYTLFLSKNNVQMYALPLDSLPFQVGLMLVIMAASAVVFDLPTFYRFASTRQDARKSLGLLFLLGIPLIEGLGVYLAKTKLNLNGMDISQFVSSFSYPALFFLIISGVFGSSLNLYSASVMMNRSFNLSYRQGVVLAGLLSVGLSMIDIQKHYTSFLELMNLNAEVLCVFLLTYSFLFKFEIETLSVIKQQFHRILLCIIAVFIIFAQCFDLGLSHQLFLDVALLTSSLVILFYLMMPIVRKYEIFNID